MPEGFNGMAKPTILVVEDEAPLLTLLRYNLEKQGFRVEEATDGQEALLRVAEARPDLILLDWMLPSLSGIEVCRQIRRKPATRDLPIIMVTARTEDQDAVRALDLGADDYITKPFSMEELLARVRANLRRVREREFLARGTAIETADIVIEPGEFRVTVAGHTVKLRLKEFQLLAELAAHSGSLLTRHALARTVWGYEHLASSRTIDVHVRRLRAALDAHSAYHYVHTVHGLGYRFEPVPKDAAEERG